MLCGTLHLEPTITKTILDIQKVIQDCGFPLEGPEEISDLETGAAGQDILDRETEVREQAAAAVMDLQGLMEGTEVLIRVGRQEAGAELAPVTQVDLEGTNHHRRRLLRHQSLLASFCLALGC